MARTTLYKRTWRKFSDARKVLSTGKEEAPHGEKNSEDGNLEAWESDD